MTTIEPAHTPNLLASLCLGGNYNTSLRRGMHRGDLRLAWQAPNAAHALLSDIDELGLLDFEVIYCNGTFEAPTNLISMLFRGARVGKWTYEGQAAPKDDESAFLRHSIQVVSQDVFVSDVKQTDAGKYDAANYLGSSKTWQDIVITKASAEISEVTRFKVDFDYGLMPIPVIRSSNPHLMKHLKATRKRCTVDLDLEFENYAAFTDMMNDTERTWTIGLGYTGKLITLTNAKLAALTCSMPKNDIIYVKARLYPQGVTVTA